MAYCGNCGHLVDQLALSSGQCTHCRATIAPNGDVFVTNPSTYSSGETTKPDVDILLQGGAVPLWPRSRDASQPLNRLGAGLGTSGGTLAAVAFFLTWIMFTSASCNGPGPVVTRSGWDIMTEATGPFNEWLLMAPVLACAVAGVILHTSTLLLPATHAARVATWNFILTLIGWVYFLLFLRQVLGNHAVHRLYPGFYLEIAGLSLLFIGAVLQVVGTMPAPTWKSGPVSRLTTASLGFALYPVAVFAVFFFAGLSSSPIQVFFPNGIGWTLLISCLLSAVAGVLTGRPALQKVSAGAGMARWGVLVSIGGLVSILYSAGLFTAVVLINHISKGH
jgi:hypothetical protein